jgi:hypothetical protein
MARSTTWLAAREGLVAEVMARRAAIEALALAVHDLAERGERTACTDRDADDYRFWTSEDATDRAHAVTLCRGCPVRCSAEQLTS